MSLLKYPVEILDSIGEYLDIFDILRLLSVDRYCYYVFNGKIDKKIRDYLLSNNLEINNIDNVNKFFYIHVILYVKRCIENSYSGILNITFMKVFSKNEDKKFNYKLFANINNKCVYFLKNIDNFGNDIDGLEQCLLKSKINNREIVKNDDISNLSNASDIVFLYRLNYNEIIEKTELNFKEELIMVTFYFFL
jgi:hypothetical protein